MVEQRATCDPAAASTGDLDASRTEFAKRGFSLSITGLVISVVAIGLASIPAIAFDRPLMNPFLEFGKKADAEPVEREGGVTFKFKDLSVNFGGKHPDKEAVLEAAPLPALTRDPIRWFSISAIASALVGLVVSIIAHVREKHTAFTVGSMGCCAAAITWQYVAIGIAVGVGAAIFIVVLSMFGSAGVS